MSSRSVRSRRRVLLLGLDGFELSVAEPLIAAGKLPNLARIRAGGARMRLDHGKDKLSGLGWEHLSSGLMPSEGGRSSPLTFDPRTYGIRHDMTAMAPFMTGLSAKTVVFDPPYCDLSRAPDVRGITNWGAHDPGVPLAMRPAGLLEELNARFGPYPATDWTYGSGWPSAEKTRAMSEALVRAVETRSRASRWVLSERLPDWDLAVVVISELHSAIEAQWHGVDPTHPLHGIPSSEPARQGLHRFYAAVDRMIGELGETFPDATIALFSMHGMGPNDSDVATMLLLPELLYRHAFGEPYMRPIAWPAYTADGTPLLDADASWDRAMEDAVPAPMRSPAHWLRQGLDRVRGALPPEGAEDFANQPNSMSIEWMPAARYRQFWHRMPAFALPAFYDGRVRINLEGRESKGMVALPDYGKACAGIVKLLEECRNVQNGEKVVEEIHAAEKNPMQIGSSEADICIVWRSAPLGLRHPRLGTIGPMPYRRTGGHTGEFGFLYVSGEGIAPRDGGVRSSFDVVPTILDLLGEGRNHKFSGRSAIVFEQAGTA